MPKQKTHKAADKRFRRTKSGKLFHHAANYNHKNTKKRTKYVRQAKTDKELKGGQAKRIRRMLGLS
jgi:large subunit ribosomal protein L35